MQLSEEDASSQSAATLNTSCASSMATTEIYQLHLRALAKVRARSHSTAPCHTTPPHITSAAAGTYACHEAMSQGHPHILPLTVFNVSLGREFYGYGGCYQGLAGRDASRLLAKGILSEESKDEAAKPLYPDEEEAMRQWLEHYQHKYEYLGPLLRKEGGDENREGGCRAGVGDDDSMGCRWRLVGDAGGTVASAASTSEESPLLVPQPQSRMGPKLN